MKALVIGVGVAGDVFPLMGVGRALAQRGHEVVLAASPHYQREAEGAGLPFCPLEGVPGTVHAADYYDPIRSMRLVADQMLIPALKPVYELMSAPRFKHWTFVANGFAYGARIAQEKHRLALTTCIVSPICLRSCQAMPVTPGVVLPSWSPLFIRRAYYNLVSRLWDKRIGPGLNAFREPLGLPPVRRIWYDWSLSPTRVIGLFPEWFAPKPADWPPQFVHGGFTVFDRGQDRELPRELLEPGDPLVVFTAGSAGEAAAPFFRACLEASRGRRWRAIVLTGGLRSFPENRPPNLFVFDYLPLSNLLPKSALVVHHGGLGTLSLALASGTPQLVIPLGHDHFDNAARVERLGAGRRLLKTSNLGIRLGNLIEEMLGGPSWRAKCLALASQVHNDRSLERVCNLIEADRQQGAGLGLF